MLEDLHLSSIQDEGIRKCVPCRSIWSKTSNRKTVACGRKSHSARRVWTRLAAITTESRRVGVAAPGRPGIEPTNKRDKRALRPAVTARKVGINFYRYIQDRISGTNEIRQLSSIIEERAQDLNLGASWAIA